MKKEMKQKKTQNAKVDISADKLDKIKNLSVQLYDKLVLTMLKHDATYAEGLTALTDTIWWLCKKFDEVPPQNENEPRALDLFVEALKKVDDERSNVKKPAKKTAKQLKGEFVAQVMYRTSLQVVERIKKVGMKYNLQPCEQDEMICSALVQYVVYGGLLNKEHIRTRTLELIGLIDEICRDVFGVKLAGDDCNTTTEKES